MTLKKFVDFCSTLDNPVGDLANDIKKDPNFPWKASDKVKMDYVDAETSGHINKIFQNFKKAYYLLK